MPRGGPAFTLAQHIWEAPQHALGAIVLAALRAAGRVHEVRPRRDCLLVRTDGLGVSLGGYVFYCEAGSRWFHPDPLMVRHELGHRVQSRLLGPLYLPLVGLPSLARLAYAIAYRELTGRKWRGYFDGYPERWADRLGGIQAAERAEQLVGGDHSG